MLGVELCDATVLYTVQFCFRCFASCDRTRGFLRGRQTFELVPVIVDFIKTFRVIKGL